VALDLSSPGQKSSHLTIKNRPSLQMRDEFPEHGHHISPGTLYPVLHRMETDGLLTSREELVCGRIRRIYTATTAAREELDTCRHALRQLADEVLQATHEAGEVTRRVQ
jgi:DNA-binding PadR family transcriptional regulator